MKPKSCATSCAVPAKAPLRTMSNDPLLDELRAHEEQVWDALVRGDADLDASLLCQSFLGVYGDGFADKSAHVGQLAEGATVQSYALTDLRARALGSDHAMLSYRARFMRHRRNQAEDMYVTSIWQRTEGGWINIFSQDTAAGEATD